MGELRRFVSSCGVRAEVIHDISRRGTLLCSASFKGLACLGRLGNEEETNTQTNDTAKLGSGG